MSSYFQIESKRSNGNLHVIAKGDFDGSAAWQLINFIRDRFDGNGCMFIDTHYLRKICPFGCRTFKCRLRLASFPADKIFFKGEKGFEIAPPGSRVIIASPKRRCKCSGNCQECDGTGEKCGTGVAEEDNNPANTSDLHSRHDN